MPSCEINTRSANCSVHLWPAPTCDARDLCTMVLEYMENDAVPLLTVVVVERSQVDAFCALSQTPRAARSHGWFKR
uniref:Uncharacterized protein n=1 Tax=Trichogramma kaykai TaxID=54128 RepID=A0ABD2VYL9_9HYME